MANEPSKFPVAAPPATEPAIARSALERVLARASELQGGEGGSDSADGGESISESRLLEVAREVGIDVNHVRQALAEERARSVFAEPEAGVLLDRMGTALVHGQRAVPGSAAEVQSRIEAWMPRMESMAIRRKLPQRTSWEPRRQALGNVLRVLSAGNNAELIRADQVIATVTPVDDARAVVRFDVELSGLRRSRRNVALGLGVVANAAAFLAVAVPVLTVAGDSQIALTGLASLGAVQAGAGYGLWRALRNGYRRTVNRVQLRVEQMLDELESGGMRRAPSLIEQVRGALMGDGA